MDSIPEWLSVVLIFALVLLSAFFSASETSFACLNRFKYMAEADSGKKSAKIILRLCERFDSTLVTTLIGYNVVSIFLSTIATFLFFRWFNGLVPDATVSLIASIVMAVILFLFGDTIPKFVGKNAPDFIAKLNCYPLWLLSLLLTPIGLLFHAIASLFRKVFHAKPDPTLTEEDFVSAIDDAEEQGVFEENESEIIQNTIDFADTSVREVLTPVNRMKALNLEGITQADLLSFLAECPYSRLPVYYGSIDRFVGVFIIKNFLNAYFQNPRVNYVEFVQKPYFVTPKVHLDDLIDGFKKNHTQIAIVRSERKIIGMVTMEDVLEELVGSIDERSKGRKKR